VPESKKSLSRLRPGKYAAGIDAVEQILNAAFDVLIDEGYPGLSLRKIAERCDMKVGNLSYYFPTKDLLITKLLDRALLEFRETSDLIHGDPNLSAEEKLRKLLLFWVEDMQSKRSTNLYTELWAMANHDPFVARRLFEFYGRGLERVSRLILALNPRLSESEGQVVAAYLSSAMEGIMIFAGHNRPWAKNMPQMATLSVLGMISLIKSVTPEDMGALDESWPFPKDSARAVPA